MGLNGGDGKSHSGGGSDIFWSWVWPLNLRRVTHLAMMWEIIERPLMM